MCLKWCTALSASMRCSNWIPAPFFAFSIKASFMSLFRFQYKGTHSPPPALPGEIQGAASSTLSPLSWGNPWEEWQLSPTSPRELVYHIYHMWISLSPSARRARAESCVRGQRRLRRMEGRGWSLRRVCSKLFLLFTLGTWLRNVAYPSFRVHPFLKRVTMRLLWPKIHKPHLFASISHPQKILQGLPWWSSG